MDRVGFTGRDSHNNARKSEKKKRGESVLGHSVFYLVAMEWSETLTRKHTQKKKKKREAIEERTA